MNDVRMAMIILLLICAITGLLMRRRIKSEAGFYAMEQKAPTLILVGAICMSYVSAVTMSSGPAVCYEQGPFVLLSTAQPGAWLGTIVAVLLVGRKLKAIGCYTLPEYFKQRFGNNNMTFLATIIMIVGLTCYGISQLMVVGNMFSRVAGIPYGMIIIIVTLAVMLFSVPAGTWGIMLTDLVMFVVLLITIFVVCPVVLHCIGTDAVQHLPSEFWSTGGLFHLSLSHNIAQFLIWFMFFSCSPLIVSRVFPARNDFAILKACLISVVLISVISTMTYMVGAFMRGVNSSIHPTEQVIVYAFMDYAPPLLGAVGVVGIMFAAISTASLLFTLAGFGISKDLYELLNGQATDDSSAIKRGQMGQLFTIAVAGFIAYLHPFGAFNISTFVTGLFAASWLPVIIFSLFWKRMNGIAAFYGMLTGSISLTVLQCATSFGGLNLPNACNLYFISILLSIAAIMFVGFRSSPNAFEIECHYRIQNVRLSDLLITTARRAPKELPKLLKEYRNTKICIAITTFLALCFWIMFAIWFYPVVN